MPAPRTSTARPRPALSAREAQALREALALRQALAAGQTLTPAQVEALRAATATATSAAARTAPVGARTPSGKPVRRATSARPAKRKPARKPTSRRPTNGKAARPVKTGARWSTRLRVIALSTLLLPAAAVLALPGSDPGGTTGGPHDAATLALTAQTTLLKQAGHYRQLELAVSRREDDLKQARDAERAARALVATQQQVVGGTAADLYRAGSTERLPVLALSVHDAGVTSAVLFQQAVVDRGDRTLEAAVVRAERASTALATAQAHVAEAEAAVAATRTEASGVLTAVRNKVKGLSPAVTAQLAALGAIPTAGAQQDRNSRALARWQAYLTQLADAGIVPPPAAAMTGGAGLPPGMSPALDAAGQPIPGVAWAVIGNSPVTVLPAETVAAVSTALSQLGKPFLGGTSGPDSYDCGGLVSAAWLLAGYAVPSSPATQWATGAPVDVAALEVGDLVFSPGGQDVGIYVGDGDVVGASAATYQVGVRSVVPGSSATRVTLPAPSTPNAAPAPAAAGPCGAPLPAPGPATPAWGGYSNGRIPTSALCEIGVGHHALRCDAAASYLAMGTAFESAFGSPLCITDSYRSYASQVSAYARKPALAAWPGTSNHGWALAVDLCGGINVAGSPQWTWMTANAARFGFVQPDWARPGAEKPEPWHWEYGAIS